MRLLGHSLALLDRSRFVGVSVYPSLASWPCYRSSSTRAPNFAHIDAKWQRRFKNHVQWNFRRSGKSKDKYYVLPMFPYPSGTLHIGHLRNYTISDVVARYRRMKGYDVLHPMGWDAFGLPAENAAIQRGINPATWTSDNIVKMKQQIEAMGGCWDWDRELRTCDSEFYVETQRLFLSLYKHGLAYQKEATVNFDPVDQTVLANEQVDSNGRSWRSGAKVEQLNLKQWFVKITDYAPRLLKDLDDLEKTRKWPQKVVAMQKTWLGRSNGAELRFPITASWDTSAPTDNLAVFTTRPDTLFGVQYIALSLDHPLVQSLARKDTGLKSFIDQASELEPDSKAGHRLSDMTAQNPLAKLVLQQGAMSDLPIFAAPYVRSGYGSGAVMGVPAHDQRDWEFWQHNRGSFEQPRFVVQSETSSQHDSDTQACKAEAPYTTSGYLTSDCHQYSGLSSSDAVERIVTDLSTLQPALARKATNWRLKDWLISRQRYWGTPIPIVHCDSCGTVPVPERALPVTLPSLPDHEWKGLKGNPLERLSDWKRTSCPQCSEPAKRETDTMDTFVDSSWYYLKFAENRAQTASKSNVMPVDLYVGGIEHAILHLLYARFISKFLSKTESKPPLNEPFERLLTQGMVHGKTYSDPITGRFLKPEELDWAEANKPKIKSTGADANTSYEKMSKSKHNGVDPIECMKTYGTDTTRAHLIFQAPVSEVLEWDEAKIVGIQRWFGRIWNLAHRVREFDVSTEERVPEAAELVNNVDKDTLQMWKDTQSTIKSVDEAYGTTFALNTVVSDLMTLTNKINQISSSRLVDSGSPQLYLVQAAYDKLIRLLAPIAPAFAEECWSISLGDSLQEDIFSVERTASFAGFPESDDSLDTLDSQRQPCAVQFNGKLRFVTEVPVAQSSMPSDSLREWLIPKALESEEAVEYLARSGINVERAKKIIIARGGRTINIVI